MSRVLAVDIGAGTMDVLYADTKKKEYFKSVVRSPVACFAEEAEMKDGPLFVYGREMGGGAAGSAIKRKAQKEKVVMTRSASATVHHSQKTVQALGIEIVEDKEKKDGMNSLCSRDINPERIKSIVKSFGVEYSFDCIGICAQDHGVAPEGVSHLDFRQKLFSPVLDRNPVPQALLYSGEDVPVTFNRLSSIAKSAKELPAKEIYIMDSGPAAILGASLDPRVEKDSKVIILDVATSHTVGAALHNGEILGFFEYHTRDITSQNIELLVRQLADGTLDHRQLLKEGGHGAYLRSYFGFKNIDIIVLTGPKRALLHDVRLPVVMGAPMGDNMMTGTAGLLEAIRMRKGWDPIDYTG